MYYAEKSANGLSGVFYPIITGIGTSSHKVGGLAKGFSDKRETAIVSPIAYWCFPYRYRYRMPYHVK